MTIYLPKDELQNYNGWFLPTFCNHFHSTIGDNDMKNNYQARCDKEVFSRTPNKRTAIDVGGNVGLMARRYANVFNHVDNIQDFLEAASNILKKKGNIIFEVPDLDSLLNSCGFDTIYHEHRQYFSKSSIIKCFEKSDFKLKKIENIDYMSGSLRIFAEKKNYLSNINEKQLSRSEKISNLNKVKIFKKKIIFIKREINRFVKKYNLANKIVVGLGAATKGNTLLNFCNLNDKKIRYILETSPYKIGKFTPGSSIPIIDENKISGFDAAIILPWNITQHLYKKFLQKKNIPYISVSVLNKKFQK